MSFAKAVAALTLAALVAASPVERDVPTTCYFIMTPSPDLGAANLQGSINYAVGHTIGVNWPNRLLRADTEPLVRHNDGTYDVQSAISVKGVSKADVAAFVDGWGDSGITLDGINVQWQVGAADCV